MLKYGKIENGVVRNVIVAQSEGDAAALGYPVLMTEGAGVSWGYAEGVLTPPPPPEVTIEEWRATCSVSSAHFVNAMTHFMVGSEDLKTKIESDVEVLPAVLGVRGDRIKNSYYRTTVFNRTDNGIKDMVNFLPYLTDARADDVFRVAEQYASGGMPDGEYVVIWNDQNYAV